MLGRVILWLIVAAAALFAIQGGEYSTMDLWRQRERKIRLQAETDSLSREVDSLRAAATAIQTDRATQERIAREEFGMVRGDKEIVYRFDEPKDSSPKR
jgi:cell division protein FtsB